MKPRRGKGTAILILALLFTGAIPLSPLSGEEEMWIDVTAPQGAWPLPSLPSFYTPIMTPLETTLGRLYHLEDSKVSPYSPATFTHISSGYTPGLLGFGSPYWSNTPMSQSMAPFQNLFNLELGRSLKLDRSTNLMEERVTAGFTLGYGLQGNNHQNDFNLLLGFISRYRNTRDISHLETADSDYGTIFFTPGLQLSGKSIMFHAILEFPVYKYEQLEESRPKQDRVRANIGVQYLLR